MIYDHLFKEELFKESSALSQMKKKSALEELCNLDFVFSQTADDKNKTAVHPQSHPVQWQQSPH